MKMTAAMLIIGSLLVFWASTFIMVVIPVMTMQDKPSDIWRPMRAEEKEGHDLYVQNGCSYCHTLFVRVNDWDKGSERIAQAGDYYKQEPPIMGSARIGPDLSEEGGEHPDDWHFVHFIDPRYTSPVSVMPDWAFLGKDKIKKLTAYVQYLGMKEADKRVARQKYWKEQAVRAYNSGQDLNIEWLHNQVPIVWRMMPNPYPATGASLARGKKIYQQFCTGCHGPIGDGQGPAAGYLMPPPLNFTTLRRHLIQNRYIGGLIYYQVMNGITGTAMPYFKRDLESAKIWDVGNYVAVSFIGYTDSGISPHGISAAYEPEWENTFKPPQTTGNTTGMPQGDKEVK
jgi:cytochrome c oxidase cbb3-type subunit 2